MTSWPDLVTAATIGVGGRPLGAIELPGLLAEPGARIDPAEAPTALLDAAALLTVARRAGWAPTPARRATAPAPRSDRPPIPEAAAAILAMQMPREPRRSLLLRVLVERGYRIPDALLPALLTRARAGDGRADIVPALGERGRWLASLNPNWAPLAAEATALLGGGRSARDLSAVEFAAAEPSERADLIARLAPGLSLADDALLELGIADRRAEVRQAARDLAYRLPGSSLLTRMAARAEPLLQVERKALRRRLVVELPDLPRVDADLARDGLTDDPIRRAGRKATWLVEIIGGAPLPLWEQRFGLSAEAIVALPIEGEFAAEVQRGWREAARRQANPDWARALLPGAVAGWRANLLPVLTPADRLAHALDVVRSGDDWTGIQDALRHVRAPWPDQLAGAVLTRVRDVVLGDARGAISSLLDPFSQLAPIGPTDYAEQLRYIESMVPFDKGGYRHALTSAAEFIEIRRRFLKELP